MASQKTFEATVRLQEQPGSEETVDLGKILITIDGDQAFFAVNGKTHHGVVAQIIPSDWEARGVVPQVTIASSRQT